MRASPILAVTLLASAGGAEARRDRSSLRHHRRRQPSRQTHPPSDGSLHRVARGGGTGDAGSARLGASLGEILVDKRGYSSMVAVRGGDKSSNNADTSSRGLSLTPQALATLAMAACMSLHYLSYSLARPATMTLFTSSRLGFGGNVSAYPLAMTFISPMSFLLLLVYGGVLNRHGPLVALKATTLGCASVLGISALLISRLAPLIENNSSLATLTKYVVGALFVFRESYVQLITSQHWSFISSVLTPGQSSTWFAPISGLTSVTSALAAMGVGKLSNLWGLTGVLATAAGVLGASVVLGEMAYAVAEKNGFNPADEHERKKRSKAKNATTKATDGEGLITKARDVFARVPTLWALFCEILACQGLSTLLNVCCVTKVSQAVPDDAERAGWMGKFFATVNVLSCILQFGVLPATSSFAEPSVLWKGMPMIMLAMTASLAFPALVGGKHTDAGGDASLNAVASAFLAMKTLEFSVRRMLDEMVYVPLDYESRFLGKEVIGVLGYRFGKSAASLALSAVTSMFGAVGLQELSYFATGASGLWLAAAWRLGNLVPTRKEADEAYERMKKEG
ncbi:hypothetical protein ACHAXT_002090 [Thalassiosira profunda]